MRLALLILLLLPTLAQAAPVVVSIGTALGASAATAFAVGLTAIQIGLSVGMAIYGAAKQRRAERAQRDAYNNSLKDRAITSVATETPYRYVYGRARVGSAIVAIFTSGDKDQFKHLVCVHAAHECDAIEEVYLGGVPLGTLDSNGGVTAGNPYYSTVTAMAQEIFTGPTFTLSHDPDMYSVKMWVDGAPGEGGGPDFITPESIVGRDVTLSSLFTGKVIVVNYTHQVANPRVKVRKHFGTPGDPVEAYLHGLLPSQWPTTATLNGFCYTIVTLDLNQPEFQGGIPPIEVLLRGKKLYDIRTGVTAWSQNPALVIYDYLTSELCGVDADDIPLASLIAAANVCDESVMSAEVYNAMGARYTLNGTVTSDQPQQDVLEKMAQAMAGGIVSTTWEMWAGKYIAPVMDLYIDRPGDMGDLVGEIAITPGVSDGDLYNGVKGQYSSAENSYVVTDVEPYQNSAYVTADGIEKWTDIDFPFTDKKQRVWNLARIATEDQRNGYTVVGQFSLKAWSLKVGQRVRLYSTLFGWDGKVFRVMNKKFSPTAPIELTLKEDAASIWDFVDEALPDATPNTNLANPFIVAPLASLTCTSGTDDLLLMGDGTIVSRIRVSWPEAATQAVQTNGQIEIEWQKIGGSAWQKTTVSGSETEAYLSPVDDGALYAVRARCVNVYLNAKSDWVYVTVHQVIGKTAPPPDISGFFITNDVLSWPEISRDDVPDLAGYRIRFQYGQNTSWANAASLHAGLLTQSPWKPELMPPGLVTLMIKAVDRSGNESSTTANIFHNFGDPIVENLILEYDDKAAGFPGTKTDCSVSAGNLLADDSGDLFWHDDNDQFWGSATTPFWPTATYKAAIYSTSYAIQSDEAGSRLTLLLAIAASSYAVEYRYDTQGTFWSDDADYFWGDDAAAFWPIPTVWQTWPGALESISAGTIEFRITTASGAVQATISALTLQFDVEDETEEIDDVVISSGGTRLALSKTYRSIKNIQLTLQDDGGSAVVVKWADKDAAAGPLIYCENSAGTKVSGVIDARIQGVKG